MQSDYGPIFEKLLL